MCKSDHKITVLDNCTTRKNHSEIDYSYHNNDIIYSINVYVVECSDVAR